MTAPKLPRGSRVTRIARWLGQQSNPLITQLLLETEGEGETADRVASWVRDKSFDPATVAQEIEDLLTSILTEQESKVVARLVWLTDTDQRWTSFPIKLEPEGGSQTFDGSQRNMLVQAQRHLEGMAQTYAKSNDSILMKFEGVASAYKGTIEGIEKAYSRTIDAFTRIIESRENRTADLENELARLRDQNAQLSAQVMQTETIAEQAVESAEAAAEELASRRDSEGSDKQMMTLLSKVAMDVAKAPAKAS